MAFEVASAGGIAGISGAGFAGSGIAGTEATVFGDEGVSVGEFAVAAGAAAAGIAGISGAGSETGSG